MVVTPLTVKGPPTVTLPDVSTVVNVPAAAKLAPMITPSMLSPVPSPSMLIVPLAVKFVNVAAAAELAPMVVPSMAPPLMSAVSVVNVFVDATVKGCPAVINSDPFVVAKFIYKKKEIIIINIHLDDSSQKNR